MTEQVFIETLSQLLVDQQAYLACRLLGLFELLFQCLNLWLQLAQLAALSTGEASIHVCGQLSLQEAYTRVSGGACAGC